MIDMTYPSREDRNKFYYNDNFLMMNKGKTVCFYVSFPNSKELKTLIINIL